MTREELEFISCHSSIYTKVILFSLNVNGISMHSSNILKCIAGTIFHVFVIFSVIKSLACILYGKDVIDYYVGMLISTIFTIILWWTLFFQKKHFFELTQHLTFRKLQEEFSPVKTILVVLVVILIFPPTIMCFDIARTISRNVPRRSNHTSCRSYWLNTNNAYVRVLLTVHESVLSYTNYIVFFTSFLMFSICGILLLKQLTETEKKIPFINASAAWRELNYYTLAFKKMERNMSFPLFLLISKIVVDIFNAVSRFTAHERAASTKRLFMISTPQITIWFVTIVILGDLLQTKGLTVSDAIYESLNRQGGVKNLGYYEYKKIKSTMNLTVWKLFKINRNLLLSTIAFITTYGVIITQFQFSSNGN